MDERFNITKATSSLVNGLDWFKAFMIGLKIVGIIFIGFTIYRAWFIQAKQQKQITQIEVQEGGTLHLKQSQKSNNKKRWETFAEVYVFCETDKRYGAGVKGGLKW